MTSQRPTSDKRTKVTTGQRTRASKTRKNNLSPNEEKHHYVLANMEEGYYELDLKGNFIFVNPAMCLGMGYDAKELLGRDYRQCVTPESAQKIEETLAKIYSTGNATKIIEYELVQKDGTRRRHEMSASLLRSASGEPVGFFGISRDRTDALRLESALRESEASYYGVMDLCPDTITINEAETGRYVDINRAFTRHTGYSFEEVIGRTPTDLNLFATEEDQRQLGRALRQGSIEGLELRFRAKDGTLLENLVSGRPIQFKGKECILFVATVITPLKEAQKALRESEESYRRVLEVAPDAISISRLVDGRYFEINDTFCHQTGYRRDEVIGRTALDINIYTDPADRKRMVAALREKGRMDGMEIVFRAKDGTLLTDLVSARVMMFKNQECVLVVATLINDLKEAQKAMVESERRYRSILEAAPDAICLTRLSDGKYIEANSTFYQRTGYSAEETIGRTSSELNIYANQADRAKLIEALKRDRQVDAMEVLVRYKDGALSYNLWSCRVIQYNEEACLLVVAKEIDELKAAQIQLRESEESYRAILDNAPYSIVVTRISDSRYLQVNEAFCRRTGFNREEAIGRTPYDLNIFVDPTDRERMLASFRRDGHVDGMEIQFRAKDGRILESLFSVTPITYHGDDCLLTMTVDIGERKRIERELAQYRQHLETMVQARTQALEEAQNELVKREKLAVLGQLTATVSHELRNPLGVIRSSNFFLQRKIGDRDEKVDKHFRRIEDQVALCDAIVADLLEFTRGRMASMVKEDLTPWLIQVIEQLQESQGIPITRDLARPLPVVPHDPEKIRRVVINVLDNAIQAVKAKMSAANDLSSDYRPQISVKSYFADNKVVIEITDNGIGMAPDTLQRAFEPLFTTRARGTGIGLAIVKKVVNEHGGDVSLESTLGEGTRFSFALPCKLQPQGGND